MSESKKTRIEATKEAVVDLTKDPKRAAVIYLPTGSINDYPEFFAQIKEGGDLFDETREMNEVSRVRFTYNPEKDIKAVFTDHGDYMSKRQKNEELPSVEVLHLVPKKFTEKEQVKQARSGYSEFVMGMYRSTQDVVNGVYRANDLEFSRLGGAEIQYDIKEF